MLKIDIIAGARPNFMKIAPIIECIKQKNLSGKVFSYRLIHTGQHYDKKMSQDFFSELGIPDPDINLGVGSGTQAEQAGKIMMGYERILLENPCDITLVVGDVTSTMACAIVAKKMNIKVSHVEAGIRSGDWTMPEEVNRVVTDSLTDFFFTTSDFANENLKKAGVGEDKIIFVGNTMIDSLKKNEGRFKKPNIWGKLNLGEKKFMVMTLHRPANVDKKEQLSALLGEINKHSHGFPVIFPVHPRTRKNIDEFGIETGNIFLTDPMGYLEFNYLVKHCKVVITDSGGITEETTVLGVPCMTLRDNTERPETCTLGTNELVGTRPENLRPYFEKLFNDNWKKGGIPPLWDGRASERIVDFLVTIRTP